MQSALRMAFEANPMCELNTDHISYQCLIKIIIIYVITINFFLYIFCYNFNSFNSFKCCIISKVNDGNLSGRQITYPNIWWIVEDINEQVITHW